MLCSNEDNGAVQQAKRISATIDGVSITSLWVQDHLTSINWPPDGINKILVCLAEALNNVVQHSGARHVLLLVSVQPSVFRIQLHDAGIAYHPLESKQTSSVSVEENGRGWVILNQWVDRIDFQRHGRINRLSLEFKKPNPE